MSFPSLPANNSTAIVNGIQYVYNSDNNTWKIVPVLVSGAQGATGYQGDTGAQGYQGDTGSQGSQGYQGVQGVIGDPGSQGFQGLRGADGAQGATGYQGDTGAQGYQGDTGSQGSQGYQGEIGSQGYQGDTGSQGSQGYQGEIGSQGYQGDTGVQGEQGTQGYQGVVGAQGATGAQGDTGVQGYQGVQGATGSQGSQGNQGYQGVQGATGSQGSQGNQGYQGVQGATGSQGNQGYQGVQGATGAQGPSATLTPSSYVVRAVKGGSTQTIPNGSDTVVTFTDDYDPQNWWTSNKFQPTIEGYYSINVQVWWEQGSITNNQTNLQLRKNGSAQVAIAQNQITSSVGYFESINTSLYFNGSTDYVEVTAYTSNPTSQNISSSNAGSWFNAELVAYGQTGAQGVQGASGAQGSTGSQGAQGVQGATGTTGAQGVTGAQGAQGSTGSQGVQGAAGAQGEVGAQGDTGAQGYQGVQGAVGAQGVQGETGSQGNQGYQGVQGAVGVQGAQGFQGEIGVQGSTGAQGYQGVQGAVGAQGDQGAQGVAGAGVATGGTAGELLVKNSSTNYDASWTDLLPGDLTFTGNVSFSGTVDIAGTIEQISGNNGVFFGYAANGFNALYAGHPTYTPLPVTVFQSSGDLDGYIQNNFENVNSGSNATADIVITSDNGTDISGYFDMGITSSNWSGQQENSLGDALEPNDAYLYVQNETGTSGGHLVIGTLQQGKKTKIAAGIGASNVVAEFSSSNLTLHNSLVLTSGTIGTPYYTLPATDGANNQVIVTDGAGNLAWANVTTTTATYTANSITLTNGVYISGNVESIQTFGDTGSGGYFNFTDGTNTGPAWIVNTDFINVVDFNRIVLNISYTQSSGHTVYVQLYNYNTSIWDSFGSYNGLAGYYQFALEALSSVPYVSGGNVQLRLYHNNTGNALHETFIDYIALEKSSQGPMGPKGAQGYQGVQGAVGVQGATGTQGSQGSQGNQGDIGAQGYQGFQGAVGVQGSQGNQGYQGDIGAQGYQGDIGVQGSQGVSVEVFYANTAPVSPMAGDQWVHSDTGIKYEYINDGTSSQWVSIPTTSNLGYTTGGGSTTVASDTLSPFLLMGA